MGCWAAVLQWQGRNDRGVVCGRDADAGRNCTASSFGRHCAGCDRKQLSRELDIPGRSLRTVVQPELDISTCAEHAGKVDSSRYECARWSAYSAAGELPSF